MKTVVPLVLTLFTFVMAAFQTSTRTGDRKGSQYDILIRNGTVIDGSGQRQFKADVGIRGDRIVKVGNLDKGNAKRVIDANGLVVAPGFIDMLGQSETYLLIDPRAMSKVMMGVTLKSPARANR